MVTVIDLLYETSVCGRKYKILMLVLDNKNKNDCT